MFIAAQFTIAKYWKQPKCPSANEWIKKLWYIYTMEFYAAERKKELIPFVIAWMELEDRNSLREEKEERDGWASLCPTLETPLAGRILWPPDGCRPKPCPSLSSSDVPWWRPVNLISFLAKDPKPTGWWAIFPILLLSRNFTAVGWVGPAFFQLHSLSLFKHNYLLSISWCPGVRSGTGHVREDSQKKGVLAPAS